jgi:YD repeat-containing protein
MTRPRRILTLAVPFLLLAGAAAAQVPDTARAPRVAGRPAGQARPPAQIGTPNYDVVLEIPELSVDSIGLRVENLRAHLALDANAANLVSLTAGADVGIDRVQLEIVGVLAEAYVYVDLDNVARIVERVLQSLDANPQLLTQLLTTVDTVVGTVGGVANQALQPGGVVSQAGGAVGQTLENVTQPGGLLSQTVNSLGQTVQRTVDQTGNLVERTLDTAGNVVGSRTLGSLLNLQGAQVVRQTTDAAGRAVRQVRDTSGAVVEYTLDAAGRIVATRVLSPGR